MLVSRALLTSSKQVGWNAYFTALPWSPVLQSLWHAEVLQGVSLQSCVTQQCSTVFLSSFLLHTWFYSLGFWIFQASDSCFSVFEHFYQILPFPDLWFLSKPFRNLGHYFGMGIFPGHCSATQKRGAVPSKAAFASRLLQDGPQAPVNIWGFENCPAFPI